MRPVQPVTWHPPMLEIEPPTDRALWGMAPSYGGPQSIFRINCTEVTGRMGVHAPSCPGSQGRDDDLDG